MREFLIRHKVLLIVLSVVFSALYLFAAILIVDILFPDVWFRIRFWGLVEDGYPGERYRMGQYFSRIFYPIIIVIALFIGFFR